MIGKITVIGPLGWCAEEFRDELRGLGYTSGSAELQMGLVDRLSRWLAGEGLAVRVLDEQVVCHFLAVTEWDRQHVPTLRTFVPLLGWLRKGLVAAASLPMLSPLDELLGRYRGWLERARGLSERTIGRYVVTSRRFLAERAGVSGGPTGVEGLTGGEVTRFLLGERSRGLSVGSMKGRAAELCSLLRFLYSDGMLEADLSASVPSVAGWRDSEIAPTLSSALVQALLDSCDRSSLAGSRDFAILVVLARLVGASHRRSGDRCRSAPAPDEESALRRSRPGQGTEKGRTTDGQDPIRHKEPSAVPVLDRFLTVP